MIEWLRNSGSDPEIVIGDTTLPVVLRRKAQAKRLVMRLSDSGDTVEVTLPRHGRTQEALAFVTSRRDWLSAQLAKRVAQREPLAGDVVIYRGEPLKFVWKADAPRKPKLKGANGDMFGLRLELGGPQASVGRRLLGWLEAEALSTMAQDLSEYCAAAAVPEPGIALSRARKRWGSCSSSGTVRVNWRLIQAPDFVRRSVVAHEVAHLVHFNHSADFYALLDRIYEGDLAAANAWLKASGRDLYIDFG